MREWTRPYTLLIITLAGVILAGGVFLALRMANAGSVEVLPPRPTPTPEWKVYVSGAVATPGVYALAPGARVQDALDAAGGAVASADLARLNLAEPVTDGKHIYVPVLSETPVASTPDGRMDINSASAEDLERLPGIGPALAGAIISYREAHGPFATVEELLLVKGIGPATLERVRDLIVAGR